jgi:hypothetical protein
MTTRLRRSPQNRHAAAAFAKISRQKPSSWNSLAARLVLLMPRPAAITLKEAIP